MEKFGNNKDDQTIVKEVVEFLVANTAAMDNVCFIFNVQIHFIQNDEVESRSRGAASTVAESEATDDHFTFPNVHQKDAFLVFRALCVLAQKDEGDTTDLRFF